jgi:membrane-bound serine protease (ClpP class)
MEWAENVVRKSASYSETEALNDSAIDMIAINEQYLLNKVDGKNIDLAAGIVILHTRGARIESFNMGIPEKLLNILSDPTIAYILLLIGLYGIMFELYNPGAILPGIVGVISLVLAFYSMQSLPVNYAGLALIVFAIMLFLLEIKISSHGMLAIGGVVSLLLGSMMLIKPGSELELVNISLTVIITATVLSALFFLLIIGAGLQAQRWKAVTGIDSMIGEMAEVIAPDGAKGLVKVNGEIWNAESLRGVISKGEIVRIKEIRDLTLYVE